MHVTIHACIYVCVRMYIHMYVRIHVVLLPGSFCSTVIILVTQAEIKSILPSLKPRNSSGYDEITHKILCMSLSHPLSYFKL